MKNLNFNHHFTNSLPADDNTSNQRRQVFEAGYSWVKPTATCQPELLIYSPEVANSIDLNQEDCQSVWFKEVFSGNALMDGMQPYAMCYGGHQFGNWAGQLGDGRAINLGEVLNQAGEAWVLQLKGAGATPYSRTADGLAVLRSSLREFLCSEAMFHLGVPTTRALSLCLTGEQVMRDMFYDGNAAYEKGAVVCRVAPSFLRFGSFQIFASRHDFANLKRLMHYTIQSHFPYLLKGKSGEEHIDENTYLAWFSEVCALTKTMVVHWQRVGFVHGVMNTDNMSILGLTIDYGPYGWLEDYNPDWTPNTTDKQFHRYAFGKQASICHWNLAQLAQAIAPLFQDITPLQAVLDAFMVDYTQAEQHMMAEKLGFKAYQADSDAALCADLIALLQRVETDMTIFYRDLANITAFEPSQCWHVIQDAFYEQDAANDQVKQAWMAWFERYVQRLQADGLSHELRKKNMNQVNPKYVLRNYLAQLAIDQADQGDMTMLHALRDVLRQPYVTQEGKESFAEKRPEWARQRAGCSMLSCSS
ncbi:MAG: YdiU family protein [Mariprofundaceae bacterium]|nr:YdiU family protein [Mariprofundaceae bacterium]